MATAPSVPASGRSILHDDDDGDEEEEDDGEDDDGYGEEDSEDEDEGKDENDEEDDDGDDDAQIQGKTYAASGNFKSRFARDRVSPKSALNEVCTCEYMRGRREVSQRWQRHVATKQCCAKYTRVRVKRTRSPGQYFSGEPRYCSKEIIEGTAKIPWTPFRRNLIR